MNAADDFPVSPNRVSLVAATMMSEILCGRSAAVLHPFTFSRLPGFFTIFDGLLPADIYACRSVNCAYHLSCSGRRHDVIAGLILQISRVLLTVPVNLRKAWRHRACLNTRLSPTLFNLCCFHYAAAINNWQYRGGERLAVRLTGTAATESITIISIAEERINCSAISKACSPLSG